MKKLIIITLLLAVFTQFNSYAQNVGINQDGSTPDPSAMLDINEDSTGILIPRVALIASNVAAPVTAPAISLMVYNTDTAGIVPNDVTPGYYYWDGTKWLRLNTGDGDSWLLEGNAGTTVGTNFLGTTDNQDLAIHSNNIEAIRVDTTGYVGIATSDPKVTLEVNGAVAMRSSGSVQALTADNQSVTVGNRSYIRLSSNSTTPADRTFTITDGLVEGQTLIIESVSTGSNVASMEDGANLDVLGSCLTVLGGTGFSAMHFVWNGTLWRQIGHNSGSLRSLTYSTPGSSYWTVPAGSYCVRIKLWGGGAAGCDYDDGGCCSCASGGSGGYVEGVYDVAPGTQLEILVAGGGDEVIRNGGIGGGARGGSALSLIGGGGGGGRSAIRVAGVDVITAGGGGGGGYANVGAGGGAGGGVTANSGMAGGNGCSGGGGGGSGTAGLGGNSCSGDNGINGGAPTQYDGGRGSDDWWEGGGGGGGWYGGGGGEGNYGSGGGGGSSYVGDPNFTIISNMIGNDNSTGALNAAPNDSDTDYIPGVGVGAREDDGGGPGLIVIYY